MSLGDTLPGIVLISLLLKLVFLAIVWYELMLPRLGTGRTFRGVTKGGPQGGASGDGPRISAIDGGSEPPSSTIHWTTDLATELTHSAVSGGAFLLCICLLLGFDLMVRDDSWIPFPVTVALDLLILGLIIALLFSPKAYAVTPGGIVRQGSVLGWKDIGDAEDAGTGLKITTRAWYRENPRLPLPKDRELRMRIMDLVRENLRTRHAGRGGGKGSP